MNFLRMKFLKCNCIMGGKLVENSQVVKSRLQNEAVPELCNCIRSTSFAVICCQAAGQRRY